MNTIKCSICGRFISYADINNRLTGYHYTPDTPFTAEEHEHWHKACDINGKHEKFYRDLYAYQHRERKQT